MREMSDDEREDYRRDAIDEHRAERATDLRLHNAAWRIHQRAHNDRVTEPPTPPEATP